MPTADQDSILNSVKKMLGIAAEYTQFDLDITIHINSVLSTLQQLGVGPQQDQFLITGVDDTWASFLGTQQNVNMVKSYIYLRVRLLFDPPASGFGLDSIANQIKEFEWRLNVAQSSSPNEVVDSGGLTTTVDTDMVWNLTGLSDFPPEAPIGATGIDFSTGIIWKKSS